MGDSSKQSLYIPKTIRDFLAEVTAIGDRPETRLSRLDDFVMMLEREKRKIEAFKRELPLCMRLIHDVIQMMKEEAVGYRRVNLQSVGYLPLMVKSEEMSRDKKSWLSSAQLWKTDDHTQNGGGDKGGEEKLKWVSAGDPINNGKGKKPFLSLAAGCSMFPAIRARNEQRVELPVSGLSLVIPGVKIFEGEKGNSSAAPVSQSNLRIVPQPPPSPPPLAVAYRKQRRSWSMELHRRFVDVLQLLGGSNVATPKQIRELMEVDGLTNDEVKSHLQKYRLHKRKTAAAAAAATTAPGYRPMMGVDRRAVMMTLEEYTKPKPKQRSTSSGSPQGPLDLTVGAVGGKSTTGGEEERCESSDRKNQVKISD